MKLEQQVCQLELAKNLKELGCSQVSVFHWLLGDLGWELDQSADNEPVDGLEEGKEFAAFTVAELGSLLPVGCESFKGRWDVFWHCAWYEKQSDQMPQVITEADTEADCRAKMLCYLLENTLIYPKS